MEDVRECEGQCPKCMSESVEYNGEDLLKGLVLYSCKCLGCGVEFTEEHVLTYNCSYTDD